MISVLVPTRNEEQDLPGCLRSVAWSDDVHVYDSYSDDRTASIAEQFGARIIRRPDQARGLPFGGNEAEHRNWALRHISFKYPWVFHIDADERVTPELRLQLAAVAADSGARAGFRVQRRDFLFGTWLQHAQASPYYIRLFRPERTRYERLINPLTLVDGAVGQGAGYLDHFPFSKGIAHWVDKHNHYSTLEALQIAASHAQGRQHSPWRGLWSGDFHERRAAQKELFYRLPARPLLKFLWLYILKRGFLDGRAGLTYARMQSMYEYLIVLKTRELAAARSP